MSDYRGVTLPKELVNQVEQVVQQLGTYRSIAEFVKEATRLRLETVQSKNNLPTKKVKADAS